MQPYDNPVCNFNPLLRVEETDHVHVMVEFPNANFNPLPPCGGDFLHWTYRCSKQGFQSTPPCGGDLTAHFRASENTIHFNPLLRVEETASGSNFVRFYYLITIHPRRVEGDESGEPSGLAGMQFQSTPSVWRETLVAISLIMIRLVFQSTPSVWRETSKTVTLKLRSDFNPLPPCGGRLHQEVGESAFMITFQSTPSVWRETIADAGTLPAFSRFQSTPSVWRETEHYSSNNNSENNFNPLPPCGGRQHQ